MVGLTLSKPVSAVKISNELVRSAQKLKLSEKRLLMMAISKITDENIDSEIAVTAIEYADFYGVPRASAYKTINDAMMGVHAREFIVGNKACRWFITRTLDTKGYIEIEFHHKIKPHIHDLKECYTQYYLRRAGDFKHIYSWRLFELLMQFRKTGLLRISLDEFKEILEIPESYNRDFALIRQKVLKRSLDEINKTGLCVKLKPIKKGRSVHMLEFTFQLEQQRDWVKPTGKPTDGLDDAYVKKNARAGESWEDARKRLKAELKKQQEVEPQKKTA